MFYTKTTKKTTCIKNKNNNNNNNNNKKNTLSAAVTFFPLFNLHIIKNAISFPFHEKEKKQQIHVHK